MAEINCSIDYKAEYELRQDIHHKAGEILKLEYINAKHCRDIDNKARKILKLESINVLHSREIERLTDRINADSRQDLFEYIKALIIEISHRKGWEPVNPNDIDMKYVEAAVRYTMPGLFSMYALLSEDDKHKIELADGILMRFGVQTTAKYNELVDRGDIDVIVIDYRD